MTAPAVWSTGFGDAAGWIGLALYIGAYLALQLGAIRGDGYLFPALNLFGALAILVSLAEAFNVHAAIGEVAWVAISLLGIARIWYVSRFVRLDPREARAAAALAPSLPRDRARALLALGAWVEARPGERLTEEGRPVAALVFIDAGRATVEHGGQTVAAVGPGALIGEMTYRDGSPATATVIAENPGATFRIDAARLRLFLARNPDVADAMELAAAGALRRKLVETTRISAGRGRANPAAPADGAPG